MNTNATSSVSLTLTCSWTLDGAEMQAVLRYRPPGQQYLFVLFSNLRKPSSVFDDQMMVRMTECHFVMMLATRRPRRVTVTETKEWAKDISVNDKCPHNGPLRLNSTMPACTRIRSPGVREIPFPLIGYRTPDTASDWPIPGPDRLQFSLSLGH